MKSVSLFVHAYGTGSTLPALCIVQLASLQRATQTGQGLMGIGTDCCLGSYTATRGTDNMQQAWYLYIATCYADYRLEHPVDNGVLP